MLLGHSARIFTRRNLSVFIYKVFYLIPLPFSSTFSESRVSTGSARLIRAEIYDTIHKRPIEWRKGCAAMPKRSDYISWDEYFMGIALLSAMRSKDPSTQVGACIVNAQNKIMSVGYNGLPLGCGDDDFPWEREGDEFNTKYPYVCHAELNAILNNAGRPLDGCKIYVALFPCNECAKAIIQCGIKEVIYISDKYADTVAVRASKRMFDAAGVAYTKLTGLHDELTLNFREKDI